MTETAVALTRTVKDLRERLAKWRAAGETIALVPTMGSIHKGHLSLVELAKSKADHVVVSLFVNPAQFGPREDFATYPRDEAGDIAKLSQAGVNLVFAPDTTEMYPKGFSTTVTMRDLTEGLCGSSRPNHFNGVATVVTKLLWQVAPDIALFGEKDYQQLLVIKRLVRDLDIPVEIVAAPIVREEDGLAFASRNTYLNEDQRRRAPLLYKTLHELAQDLEQGRGCDAAIVKARFKLDGAGFRVDYITVRDPDTLKTLEGPVKRARVLAAVYLGQTRLIDNVPVPFGEKQH